MRNLEEELLLAASLLGAEAASRGHVLTTAESCTGGMVAAAITDVAGSSAWFDRGFVTYAVRSKTEVLDVPAELIDEEGVVSEAVAKAMARGALARSRATLSTALTGTAGPGGGTPEVPVGTVAIGWGERTEDGDIIVTARTVLIPGERRTVRLIAARIALQGLMAYMGGVNPRTMPCEY